MDSVHVCVLRSVSVSLKRGEAKVLGFYQTEEHTNVQEKN